MSEVEKAFSCTNCHVVTKESDYPKESHHLYEGLKRQGLCETCAKMPEDERKEYAMGLRLATRMVEIRRVTLGKAIERLTAERTALDSISPKKMALETLQEERKRKEAVKEV